MTKQCPECGEWCNKTMPFFDHYYCDNCQEGFWGYEAGYHQPKTQEERIPEKSEMEKESITDRMSKKWYDL